ncbi:hypothetical protein OK411_13925 [Pseudomonas sp. RG1]|uniref:hypothetical protein n=1 Tax=Pseudomonas sp. RG1 TaxID=2981602 RepID=UPI0022211E55|nr:hypothetical protein [Pseudomonas sp. RG1]MCW0921480.1 hypothetical protein [Pseudomonas sp. RG1]
MKSDLTWWECPKLSLLTALHEPTEAVIFGEASDCSLDGPVARAPAFSVYCLPRRIDSPQSGPLSILAKLHSRTVYSSTIARNTSS